MFKASCTSNSSAKVKLIFSPKSGSQPLSASQENILASQRSVDGASTLQVNKEREELIEKDEELKRILEMPRKEMKKILSLRQEKEKLERKIRIKGLENHILKLQKELKHLEIEKEELENEFDP